MATLLEHVYRGATEFGVDKKKGIMCQELAFYLVLSQSGKGEEPGTRSKVVGIRPPHPRPLCKGRDEGAGQEQVDQEGQRSGREDRREAEGIWGWSV